MVIKDAQCGVTGYINIQRREKEISEELPWKIKKEAICVRQLYNAKNSW